MKKVTLLFEPCLSFSWRNDAHGEAILTLIDRFNDAVSFVFCNPHMPADIGYSNYLHVWLHYHEDQRKPLKEAAKRTYRLSARIHPNEFKGWVLLTINFFEKGANKPFARLITHLNINLSSDDAPSGDETSEKTTFEMLKE
jgi:hypothetical protein